MRSGLCSAEWSKLPSQHFLFFPLSFFPFVVFFHWHERQRFPTLVNFFVFLCTVLRRQRCSVLECTSSLSLLSLLTFPSCSSPLHPFSHLTATLPPPPSCVSPVLPTSQCFSHLLSPILSLFLLSSPLSGHPPSPPAPFSLTFLSSPGLQTAERLSTKVSHSSPHTAPSITPTGYSPWHCAKAHTQICLVQHWIIGTHMHPTNK